jgi:hypothetical protein
MSATSGDNLYAVGAFVTAKVNPTLPLVIQQYYQRIYYCAVVGEPGLKNFAYFEDELTPPKVRRKIKT